jgi:hypothetical protein
MEDITSGYIFTVIAEQLKRLEALIRQADFISKQVTGISAPSTEDVKALLDMSTYTQSQVAHLEPLLSGGYDHPIFLAALDEAARVGEVLGQLRAGTMTVTKAARLGLLDSLRNSVWSKVDATSEDRAQVTYSVFQSVLTNLSRITSMPSKDVKGNPITRVLEFTIPILTLSRSYTVYWSLGGSVYVNMVKSRVVTDHIKAVSTLSSLASGLTMLDKPSRK